MADVSTYNFSNPAVAANPFPYYAAMRRQAPVHIDPGTGWYWLARYEDVAAAAADSDTFSSRTDVIFRKTFKPAAEKVLRDAGLEVIDVLATSDPPLHDDYRRVAMQLVPPKKVNRLLAKMETVCDQLIDDFIESGEANLNTAYSRRLIGTMLASELDLGLEDLDRFKEWAECTGELNALGVTEEQEVKSIHKMVALMRYLAPRIRHARGDDSMIGTAIHSIATMNKRDGSPFSDTERGWLAFLTFVGGNNSTVSMVNMSLLRLATDPALQDELRLNFSLIGAFVDEMLRLESAIQSVVRVTTRDTEVRGTKIPEGATVILSLGSANRDEERWGDDAHEFRLGRPAVNRHQAFNGGRHVCAGLHLARAEIAAAAEGMLRRTTSFRLLDLPTPPSQLPSVFFRSITDLNVSFEPR